MCIGDNSHFIVVYRTKPKTGRLYVSDSAKELISYGKEECIKKWIKKSKGEKGVLMALEPQADFYLRQGEEGRERKKTLRYLRIHYGI